jgi:hypothetical protein
MSANGAGAQPSPAAAAFDATALGADLGGIHDSGRSRANLGSTSEAHVNLEETLSKVAELSHEELTIVRKRAEEKTTAREHGHDFHEMQRAAERLDHYAQELRKLHDNEFGKNWREKT